MSDAAISMVPFSGTRSLKVLRRVAKRVLPLVLAVWLIPKLFVFYAACGCIDFLRNRRRTLASVDRYFAGNGFFTWMLSPLNLFVDLLSFPFRNRGIYQLGELPQGHQDEIRTLIEAAKTRNLVQALESKVEGQKRGMIFFKWYGKNVESSVEIPEFHAPYRYIRTIGVSIFNKRQSTTKHFGPLRLTLRVLYNINDLASRNVYITVGNKTHHWQDEKLFIFDDTLQHRSCNESEEVRYCMFVDILRPSLISGLTSGMVSCVRALIARFNFLFYRHWTFIK